MKKVAICTLGCKVNQYESEEIISGFLGRGCELVDFSETADIYIINTCTVTSTSDHKSRQMIRRAVRANPEALVAVTGCYAEREAASISRIDGVRFVVGNKDKRDLSRIVLGEGGEDNFESSKPRLRTRALIKVQDGCDQFCSFCQIPYVRGMLRSRPLLEILSEAEMLVEAGAKEIVLTGIHLGKYGFDAKESGGLVCLLDRLQSISGLFRIRLSSIETREVTEDLVGLIAHSDKICRHLHIPLQSGSDRILRGMNRNYSAKEYLEAIRNIRVRVADIAVTTDLIVGFPGETEEDFRQSLRVCREAGFAKIHVFNFSARPGTPAATMERQISAGTRRRRSEEARALNEILARNYGERFLKKRLGVLLEERKGDLLTGTTDNYLRAAISGPEDLLGELVEVELLEFRGNSYLGRATQTISGCGRR